MAGYRRPARPEQGQCDALAVAVHERMLRACEVKESYFFEDCGSGTYFVQHPTEDVRCYVVQLGKNECDCPDFSCRPDVPDCKHLLAVKMITGQIESKVCALPMPEKNRPDYETWFTPCVDPDSQDPYRD